jgi:hypothetical protein
MKREGASTTGGLDYCVRWSDCSETNALMSNIKHFHSKFDAWNFVSQLSSFGNCSNITLQIKVANNWVPILGVLERHSQRADEGSRFERAQRERLGVEKIRHLSRFKTAA